MILSFDVGIKNLSYCLLDIQNNKFIIKDWGIINLLTTNCNLICSCNNKNKKPCKNKAAYYSKSNNLYYCKKHLDHKMKAPEEYYKFIKTNKFNIKKLSLLKQNYNLPSNLEGKEIFMWIGENLVLELPKPQSCQKINLVEISKSINKNFNKLFFKNNLYSINTILIENQIGPLANRMKSIQGMITQFFVDKNISDIHFISSQNKLKNFNLGKLTYPQRKKQSIEITKQYLEKDHKEWVNFFNNNKKKDDLADSFLQALWFMK